MADNVIDTLSIQIKSSSQGATNAINTLVSNLERLSGALSNYSRDSGEYGRAMTNLQDGLEGLNATIGKLDTAKLKSVSQSISTLANSADKLKNVFGDIGLSKATRDASALKAEVDKAVQSLMSMYKTSKSATDLVAMDFEKFMKNAPVGKNVAIEGAAADALVSLSSTLEDFATKEGGKSAEMFSNSFLNYLKTYSGKTKLPFSWKDIAGDWESAQKMVNSVFGVGGYTFDQNSAATGIHDFVSQMNEAIGTTFDTNATESEMFNQLYEAVLQAKQGMLGFSQGSEQVYVDLYKLADQLMNSVSSINQFKESLASIPVTSSDESPFMMLATSLKGLEGVTIPDFSGLAMLASSVGKLANKNASIGIQLLPNLVSGLQSLNALNGIVVPDLAGLADLCANIGKLSNKKANQGIQNLPTLVQGLSQLNALKGMTFPDIGQLTDLAQAFAIMGRETSGRAVQNIPQLAKAFRQLMQTLSTAPRVSNSVIKLAEAMSKLSANGSKVGSASRAITSAFDRIKSSSQSLTSRIIAFGKNLLTSARNADHAGSKYTTLASKLGLLYAKYWAIMRIVNIFSSIITPASNLIEVQNVVDTTFGNMSKKVEDFSKNAIKDFGLSELAAKQTASRYQAMGTAMGITGQQVQKAQQFLNMRKTLEGNAVGYDKMSNSMADMSINLTKLSADMASFYNVDQSQIEKALASGVLSGQSRPLRTYGLDLTNATLKEWAMKNGLDANIKSMTQAEKTLLRYQYVMANTSKVQGDFSRTANTWHNQIVILKQQFQQLAVVIGSGLIQALKPFVMQMNAALSGLIKFAQEVVNALGKIFGWEMEVNTKGLTIDDEDLEYDTSGLEDIGDTADDSAKSVKKLKDQLQGFDKLNVLRTTTNNGSNKKGDDANTSGSGIGIGEGDVAAGLKKTKSAFESEIDNLFDLGRYISDKLATMLENIPWDKIYEKARKFGTGLANFLNGLITPRLFADVGRTIGNSINSAFEFLNSFGQTFDWGNFGTSIGAGINGFLHSFNWGTIFSAAKTWGKGLATTINNALATTSFTAIGRTLAYKLTTIFTFLENFFGTLDWQLLGQKIADGINGYVENFPAAKIARTANKFVQGLFTAIMTAVQKVKWDKVVSKIAEFFSTLDFKTIAIVVGALSLLKGASLTITIAKAILDAVARKIVTNIATSILAEMAASPVLSKALGKGLGDAAQKAAGGGYLGTAGASLGQTLFGGFMVGGGIYIAVTNFLKMWNDGWSLAGEIFKDLGIAIAAAGAVILGVLTGPLAIGLAAAAIGLSSLAIAIKDHWSDIKEGVKEKIDGLITSSKQLGKDFLDIGTTLISTGESIKSKVSTSFKTLATNVVTSVSTLKSNAESKWEDLKKNVVSKADSLKTNVEGKWETLKTKLTTKMNNIKTALSTKWQDIKTDAENKVTSISNSVPTMLNGLSEKVKKPLEAVKKTFNNIWTGVSTGANNGMIKFGNAIIKGFNDMIKRLKDLPGSLQNLFKFKLPSFSFETKTLDIANLHITYPSAVRAKWNKKAYSNPLIYKNPTVIPTMNGYQGYGDGNGGEMVYGHKNLMNDISEAMGNGQMTAIGNRQLANDQRIIQLLSVIANKEFGITSDALFRNVRDQASNYTMRTGKQAFEF